MNTQVHSECVQMLLDLVCYEKESQRLSPEMERILETHLSECPSCRRGIRNFKQVVSTEEVYRNFG